VFVFGKLGSFGPLHLDDDVSVFERIGTDGSAGRGKLRIGQTRLEPCSRLDRDLDAKRLELLHGIGRGRDPRLGGIDFLGDGNLHEASRRAAQVGKL
jgi:hypothetical protein